MRNNIVLAALLVLAFPGTSLAGGKEGTIGAGVEFGLNGLTGGGSISYDAGKFHFGGFLGFSDNGGDDDTDYTLGGRFYYHLHETTMSDFGIGGGLGFYSEDHRGTAPLERQTLLYFEPGVQIRAFVANNVALSFTAGLSFELVDENSARIGGHAIAGTNVSLGGVLLGGIHYYFFQ